MAGIYLGCAKNSIPVVIDGFISSVAALCAYTKAQVALGRLYLSGFEEMGSDPAEAESWLLAAAGKGDPEAKKLLEEAQKAKKDEVEYRRWVNTHRALWMGYWWNAYHYYTYWQAGYWYYY